MTGVENTMILADQFVLGILTDGTELLVDISNRALHVGDRYDGVLIESKFLISQLLERSLAGGEAFLHSVFGSLALCDVRTDGNVLPRFAIAAQRRDDGRIHPIDRAIFGPVLNLAVPNLPIRDGVIHLLEKLFRVMTGVENTMILADQFILGILTDGTELLVDISNRALHVGDRYDGVLIESKFLISQLLERSLAGGEAFFHSVFGSLALCDVRTDGNVLPRFAIAAQRRDDGRIHPIDRAIFGPVLNLAVPNLPIRDGVIHLLEKLFRVMTGVENTMILADQFILGILTDGAELLVDITNRALDVGDRYDGVLIESKFLISQLLERSLAGGEAFFHSVFGSLALCDVRTDGNVLPGFAIAAQRRDDGRIHPIDRAIFGPVLNLAVPNLPIRDGVVHLLEEFFGVVAGVENPVILADQFLLGILTDGAELLVHISNRALDIRHRHDGVLIESKFLIGQLFERSLAGNQALFHRLLSPLPFGDVGAYSDVLPRFAILSYERDNGRVYPVDRAILGPVLNFAVPNLPVRDGVVHLLKKFFGVVTGVENPVILADQLLLGILTDGAELLVHISNRALDISHRHDGVLIESKFLIGQLFERSLAGNQALFHRLLRPLPFGDVGAYSDVLPRFAILSYERDNGRVYPVDRAILGPVLNFAVPNLPGRDGVVHLLKKFFGVVTGVENPVILADQLLLGILTDGAELLVHISNRALDISHRHDSVLIESKYLIGQLFERSLAGNQALFHRLLSPLPFGDVGAYSDVLPRFAILSYERDNGRVYPVDRAILGPVLNFAVPNLP